jgi:hypothetical protein
MSDGFLNLRASTLGDPFVIVGSSLYTGGHARSEVRTSRGFRILIGKEERATTHGAWQLESCSIPICVCEASSTFKDYFCIFQFPKLANIMVIL